MKVISLFSILLCMTFGELTAYRYPFETAITKYLKPVEISEASSGLELIDCIYLINLDERPERWNRMKELCDVLGIKVNRVSAINGWKLSKDIQDELIGPYLIRSGYLGGGRIGCFLTHLSIFKDACKRGFNVIWILEDDAEFIEDIKEIPLFLKKLSVIDPQWDAFFTDPDWRDDDQGYIVAQGIDPRPDQKLHPLSHYIEKTKVADDIVQIRERYGTHSILWSRQGIEKVLDYFSHVYLWTSIDIDIHYIPGIREYAPTRDLVTNLRNHSTSDTIPESSLNPENQKRPPPH